MAYTINQLKAEKQTAIFGRRIALDRRDYIVGPAGLRLPVEDISSTVPTTVSNSAITRIKTSGSSQGPTQHNLPAPVIGNRKVILLTSTSTGSQQFLSTPNGASIFATSLGTTVGVVNFVGPGGGIVLRGISASEWAIESIQQITSTALAQSITFTTST